MKHKIQILKHNSFVSNTSWIYKIQILNHLKYIKRKHFPSYLTHSKYIKSKSWFHHLLINFKFSIGLNIEILILSLTYKFQILTLIWTVLLFFLFLRGEKKRSWVFNSSMKEKKKKESLEEDGVHVFIAFIIFIIIF